MKMFINAISPPIGKNIEYKFVVPENKVLAENELPPDNVPVNTEFPLAVSVLIVKAETLTVGLVEVPPV